MEEERTELGNDRDIDWLLQVFVDVINSSRGLSIGVTLTVGGATIVGDLIGYDDWMEEAATAFEKSEGEVGTKIGPILAKAMRSSWQPEPDDDSEPKQLLPHYIHLRNARIYLSADAGPVPSNKGLLWRGRLAEVDGFAFGAMQPAYN